MTTRTNYRFPGQVLQKVFIKGTGVNKGIQNGLSATVPGSLISTTVNSSEEVVKYEVNLYYFDTNEQDFLGIYIFRDATEIYNTFDGLANGVASMGNNFYTSFLERPGVGTFVYSFKTNAQTTTSSCVQANTWVCLTRYYLPSNSSVITTNTVTL